MKKETLFIAALIAIGSLQSCSKYSASSLSGTYSYKKTGNIEVSLPSRYLNLNQEDISLNEIGSLDIRKMADTDSVILLFNPSGDKIYHSKAYIQGDSLKFEDFHREIEFYIDTLRIIHKEIAIDTLILSYNDTVKTSVKDKADIIYSGFGLLYDELIKIDLSCKGESEQYKAILSGEDINIIAKKN
ncbi:MAG: hypothetical protein ACI3ZF_01545 [Candidatus Cryptobacteroides sp.]